LALCGCVRSIGFPVEGPPSFNDKIRLDRSRAGLEPEQRDLDPTRGTFRDGFDQDGGEGEVVSELFPTFRECPSDVSDACPTEKLTQSDCWWAAAHSGRDGLDALSMNWEMLVRFTRGSFVNELDHAGKLRAFGSCRFADPLTGERARIDFEKVDPAGSNVEIPGFEWTGYLLEDGPVELDLGDDRLASVVELTAVAPASGDGVCPRRMSLEEPWRPLAGGASREVPVFGKQCQALASVDENGADSTRFPACGYRCGIAPTADGALRLAVSIVENGETKEVERFVQPNLFVVPGERTIVRPMRYDDELLVWHTPVLGNAEEGFRWHENWSPNVLVERVRVYELRDGREVPPA
jgi:hypothetical protein